MQAPVRQATSSRRTSRLPQSPAHPRPVRPCWRGTGSMHETECQSGKSCRTAHRSDTQLATSLSRVTPSAVSERLSELIGCPISCPFPLVAFVLNQGPFPPPALPGFVGTTDLSATPRCPACPSPASGWSSPTTAWGFPCCARFPYVYMLPPLPRRSVCVHICSIPQTCQFSPKGWSGQPAHRPFRGLLGVHSRCGLHTRAVTNS